jgi:membrane-associated protein
VFDLLREFFSRLRELESLLTWGGYPVLMIIIFAETGLLIGFFLPGDSLLVTAGVLVNAGMLNPFELSTFENLLLMNAVLIAMAVIGDAVGYSIGLKAGPKIFTREQSLLFRKDHLIATQKFYEKHGGKTIVIARFMPAVRTFAPVVAGVGQMGYRRFATYNIAGGIGWVTSMTFLGYFLGKVLGAKQIERVVYLIIFLSVLPLFIGAIRHRMAAKKAAAEGANPGSPSDGPLAAAGNGTSKAASNAKAPSSSSNNNVSQNSVGE